MKKGFLTTIAVFFISCFGGNSGEISLQNKTNEKITFASIKTCKENFEIKNIKPENQQEFVYNIKGDCNFSINVRFQSGKTLFRKVGYVTSGFDFEQKILIYEDAISFHQRIKNLRDPSKTESLNTNPWSLDSNAKMETTAQDPS